MKENPVEIAARWAAIQRPPPQRDIMTNYSYLAELLGVTRQVIQRHKKNGRWPQHHIDKLVEISGGKLTRDMLAPMPTPPNGG